MERQEAERLVLRNYIQQRFKPSKSRIVYFVFLSMLTEAVWEAGWENCFVTSSADFSTRLRKDLVDVITGSVKFVRYEDRVYVNLVERPGYDNLKTIDRRHSIDLILADLSHD